MLKGAIFDLDGTLLDSMGLWNTLGERYLNHRGMTAEPGLNEILVRMSLPQGAAYLKEHYPLTVSEQEIMSEVNDLLREDYAKRVQLKPGAKAFLLRLKEHGVKLCVATATDLSLTESALKRLRIREWFDGVLTCRMVGHGKDEPVIYERALALLGTPKEQTAVFEDAVHAAKTAKQAGFPLVGVFDAYEPKTAEVKALADCYTEEYRGLEGLFS